MRIAVYQAGALGDMLLTFPALNALRQQWPDAHSTLICRADVHALALASGLADRTLSHELAVWTCLFDGGVSPSDLAREIFAGADLALVSAQDVEGEIVSRLNTLGARKALIVEPPPRAGSRRHVALQLLDALAPLGIAIPDDVAALAGLPPPLRWPQEAQDEADEVWERMQGERAGRQP